MNSRMPTDQVYDLSPPGELLEEALHERGMHQVELARRAELSEKHVSQLVNGRVPLSVDVALKLERVLGIPAHFWVNLESNFRAEQARKESREALKAYADWVRKFPMPEMVRLGYLRQAATSTERRAEMLLDFFGVTSDQAWEREWSAVTARFRKSPAFNPNRYVLTAWLRRCELEGRAIECAPFDAARFREALDAARRLTSEEPQAFLPRLRDVCAASGVALAVVPSLPGLAIAGATRWLGPDKALLSLSLRHKSDDQLWFSFFHEACHVLEHKTAAIYIDDLDRSSCDLSERQADQFARDALVPPDLYERFLASFRGRLSDVVVFAQSIGVSPGIIVGRLQRDKRLPFSHGNHLKLRLRWGAD